MTYRIGCDISHWQDDNKTPQGADFNKMANAGAEFLFLKASQNTWDDEDFIDNFRNSQGIIPRSAYHFFDDRTEPSIQAEHFYSILVESDAGFGELPLVIDIETTQYWDGTRGKYDPPRNCLPDTAKPVQDRFNPLNKEWQLFWFELLKYFSPDMEENELEEAWLSLTSDARALTDHHAWNTVRKDGKVFAEYVVGHNIGSPNGDMQIKELGMGGNIFKVLKRDSGRIWVDAFDVTNPPPKVEDAIKETPWLIHWATESCCTLKDDGLNWDGIPHVKPFPQVRDKDNYRTGIPYPLCGLGGEIMFNIDSSFAKKSLQFFEIKNGEAYSPYIKRQ